MAFTPTSVTGIGGQIVQITSTGNLAWTTSINISGVANGDGGLYTNAGATVAYAPGAPSTGVFIKLPNISESFTINQTGGGSLPVSVTGQLHVAGKPSYAVTLNPQYREVNFQTKRDGSINGRVLSDMVYRRDYDLQFVNNTVAEYNAMEAFWFNHAPGKNLSFGFTNQVLNISGNYMFSSEIQVTALANNRVTYKVSIIEVP
jgi:hypothetical protein